jgi:hypothetical protein
MSDDLITIGGQTFVRAEARAKVRVVARDSVPDEVTNRTRAIASDLHWVGRDNPDLVYVQVIMDTEGPNANWDYQPRAVLMAKHSTAVFKPWDMDHIVEEQGSLATMSKENPPVRNTIFGVMTATALCWASTGELLTEDEIKDVSKDDRWDRPDGEKVAVMAWAALYRFLFPKTVDDIVESANAGDMYVSMERWIAEYDFLVWNPATNDYGSQTLDEAKSNGIFNRWKTRQTANGKPVYRRSVSCFYGGIASTTNPANKMARFVEPSFVKSAAASKNDAVLEKLLAKHGEVHAAFALASCEDQPRLIAEHERITRAIAAYVGGSGSEPVNSRIAGPDAA